MLGRPKRESKEGKRLYNWRNIRISVNRSRGTISTDRSVTMSNTAPNLEVCPNARAAWPSTASSRHETVYKRVQYLG